MQLAILGCRSHQHEAQGRLPEQIRQRQLETLSPACVQPPDAYQVSFHYGGNDALARQFDYVRAIGTGAFVRTDGRI